MHLTRQGRLFACGFAVIAATVIAGSPAPGRVIYDSGVPLGAGRLQDRTVLLSGYDRKRLTEAAAKLEKRYRQEASKLIDDLLRGWRELRG